MLSKNTITTNTYGKKSKANKKNKKMLLSKIQLKNKK